MNQGDESVKITWNRFLSLKCIEFLFTEGQETMPINTGFPAYSDSGYSDAPLTMTLMAIPKSLLIEIIWLE